MVWRENIDKVNSAHLLAAARNPGTNRGYDGVQFEYCPWCGAHLRTPSLLGIKVVVDPSMPQGTIEMRGAHNTVRVENLDMTPADGSGDANG